MCVVYIEYGTSADIWSLGVTIIEMAQGQPPWYNKDAISAMFFIANNTGLVCYMCL